MSDKITLDKESFKALAIDSRINILKELDKRRKTLSELSTCLNLGTSSVKEHLQILESSGLVKKIEEGRKWKYYELTWKGKNIVNPTEIKILITLGISFLALIGMLYLFFKNLPQTLFQAPVQQLVTAPVMTAAEEMLAVGEGAKALPEAAETVAHAPDVSQIPTTVQFPWIELILVFALLALVAFCIGYLFRKKY